MSETKTVTIEDLKANSSKESCYIVINGQVYDATKFLDEHPGGDEVILSEAGKDGTDAFEDVGHSDEARALLPKMLVGTIEDGFSKVKAAATSASSSALNASKAQTGSSSTIYLVPLAALGGYLGWRFYAGQ